MATNIPPHNLGEVVDACLHAARRTRAARIDELIKLMPAPDFPTRGIIYGLAGVHEGYRTGRGRVVMRARTHFEEFGKSDRTAIIVDELPYQVNKADAAREDRRAGAREAARGHLRPARRVGQVGHARGDRVEARRAAGGGAQQPLQDDAAPGHLPHEHGGAGGGPAADPQPQGPHRLLPRAPARGGHAAHGVRAAQGARARPRAGRPGGGAVERRRR